MDGVEQPKRKPGRPRKVPTDEQSSQAGAILRDPEATPAEKSVAAAVLASDPVAGPNEVIHTLDRRRTPKPQEIAEAIEPVETARPTSIGPLELDTLKREAWEAFDYQEGRGKADTLGRIWQFEPETINNNTVVSFSLRRLGGETVERVISTAQYGTDGAREKSDETVEQMNGLVK